MTWQFSSHLQPRFDMKRTAPHAIAMLRTEIVAVTEIAAVAVCGAVEVPG